MSNKFPYKLMSLLKDPQLIPIILIVGLLTAIYLPLRNKYGYGLRRVPGPWVAGFSDLYRLKRVLSGTAHLKDIQLHRKYGHVVRLGPNTVSVGDPKAIPAIYGISASLPKSNFYPVNYTYDRGKLVPGIFATTDDGLHRHMKRPIANLYSMTNVLAYEPLVNDTIRIMIDQLDKRFAATGDVCVFSDWLQFYAFDVIGTVTFSNRIGFLERGEDIDGVIEGIWKRFKYWAPVGQMPWLDKFWDKSTIINTILPAKSSPIAKFAMQLITKRLEQLEGGESDHGIGARLETSKKDLLSSFLEVKAKGGDKIPNWYLSSWTISNMLAGSDTTAIYLRSIFYFLLCHPESLERVVHEIDAAHGAGRLSEIVTYKESKALVYLDPCIKESGRVHPSIGFPLERVAPRGGLEINGYHLPEGTIVGVSAWTSQRDPALFGEDADEWKPERWLQDTARTNEMERAMMLFGTGHRSCIGKHIATIEIYKIVPQLLREYKIELVRPDRPWTTENFWIVRQTDLDVYLRRRNRVEANRTAETSVSN